MHSRNKLPVIVGGTNYYIESLLWKVLLDTGVSSYIHKYLKYMFYSLEQQCYHSVCCVKCVFIKIWDKLLHTLCPNMLHADIN